MPVTITVAPNATIRRTASSWILDMRLPGGRRKRPSLGRLATTTQDQAIVKAAEIIRRHIVAPDTSDPTRAPTLEAWVAYYIETRGGQWAQNTAKLNGLVLNSFVASAGPEVRLTHLTAGLIWPWIGEQRERGLADATVKKNLRIVRAALEAAEHEMPWFRSPARAVKIRAPKVDRGDARRLSQDELDALYAAAAEEKGGGSIVALIALCRLAGTRCNEALRLTWDDIDFAKGRVEITPKGGRESTKQRRRLVPLRPALAEILLSWRDRGAPSPCYGLREDDRELYRRLDRIRVRAGVEPYGKPLHELRSMCEMDWLRDGHQPEFVAAWLGHSVNVMRGHYLRPDEAAMDEAAGQGGRGALFRLVRALPPEMVDSAIRALEALGSSGAQAGHRGDAEAEGPES